MFLGENKEKKLQTQSCGSVVNTPELEDLISRNY